MDERDCEANDANAGQLLYKNNYKHRQFAAESLENDRHLQKSKISKLKLYTGKNNRFQCLDILGYLTNTHKNPKFGRVRQVPIWELSWEFLVGTCLTLPNLGFLWVFFTLNFSCVTSKPKGYLLQTTKLWEKLIVLNRRMKKATKPKEEVNFLSLKRVKFVKMTIFYSV